MRVCSSNVLVTARRHPGGAEASIAVGHRLEPTVGGGAGGAAAGGAVGVGGCAVGTDVGAWTAAVGCGTGVGWCVPSAATPTGELPELGD